ncbi:MAG: hypothetical protein ABF463_08380 [Ethanoligenens sp.]
MLKASYERNKGRTGLNKLLGDVRLKFSHCGRNRLYHIQKEHQLYSIRKRKFKATTKSSVALPAGESTRISVKGRCKLPSGDTSRARA